MALTDHQKSVLSFLNTVESATKKEIKENVNFSGIDKRNLVEEIEIF